MTKLPDYFFFAIQIFKFLFQRNGRFPILFASALSTSCMFQCCTETSRGKPTNYILYFSYPPRLEICHCYQEKQKQIWNRKAIIYSHQDTVWHHMVGFIKFLPFSCRANRTEHNSRLCEPLIHLHHGPNPAHLTQRAALLTSAGILECKSK